MKKLFVIPALLLGFACLSFAAAGEDEIRAAEKEWATIVAANDFAKIDALLGPDLIYGHSTGAVETKAEYMKRLHSGAQKYDSITHDNTIVKMYGNTAVAHSHVHMMGKSNGAPFDDHLLLLHVWVKNGGKWQLVGHQTAKLAPPAATK